MTAAGRDRLLVLKDQRRSSGAGLGGDETSPPNRSYTSWISSIPN